MAQVSRRDFLKLLPTLPFIKVAWPYTAPDTNQVHYMQDLDQPNILFLVFDTLSAKHVSLHGYKRATTPNLARFAERATVFHHHQAAANFTSPGTASILTGTYPWSHRAFHLHSTVDNTYSGQNVFSLLPDHYYKVAYTHNLLVTSLLHQFRNNLDLYKQTRELCLVDGEFSDLAFWEDYSAAFWAEWLSLRGSNSPPSTLFLSMIDRGRRFSQKSELTQKYGSLFPRGIPSLHSLFFILEDAIDWIKEQVNQIPRPFFGYFHLLPPHEPYSTRHDFVDVFADQWRPIEKEAHFSSEGHSQQFLNRQRREYDEYLAYTDSEFGRLLDNLQRSGVLDDTYIVLTSDHGELFERGIRGHVTPTLYEPLIHVPLLISRPKQKERVDVFTRTSCVDLLPTLLQLTGQQVPNWCEGQVLPTFGGQEISDRSLYAVEAKSNPKQASLTKATVTITKDRHKLMCYSGYNQGEPVYELYDLENDPEEMENLYDSKTLVAAELQDELVKKLQEVNQPYQR